jgi:hypothetical protein
MIKIDLTGQKFGRLEVTGFAFIRKGQTFWNCICNCGKSKTINGSCLRTGQTKSCGCYRVEKSANIQTKHGFHDTRLYAIWKGMKTRCYNRNSKSYNEYGGRGIIVYEEWKGDFLVFHDWAISRSYADDLSIDRIDPNGNYCPSNCRWATAKDQSVNRRNVSLITLQGKTQCLTDWSKDQQINYKTVNQRLKRGWTIEESLGMKKRQGVSI